MDHWHRGEGSLISSSNDGASGPLSTLSIGCDDWLTVNGCRSTQRCTKPPESPNASTSPELETSKEETKSPSLSIWYSIKSKAPAPDVALMEGPCGGEHDHRGREVRVEPQLIGLRRQPGSARAHDACVGHRTTWMKRSSAAPIC